MSLSSRLYRQPWKKLQLIQSRIEKTNLFWVADQGSLTQKLVSKSNRQFRVEVLQQRIQKVPFSEKQTLNISSRRWAVIREVILYGKGQPWVYARTVIPLSTLSGSLRHLHYLGNKPLGEHLFKDPTMRREVVEATLLSPQELPQKLKGIQQPVWGRRSVFRLSNKPLLVSEIFLPGLLNS